MDRCTLEDGSVDLSGGLFAIAESLVSALSGCIWLMMVFSQVNIEKVWMKGQKSE